MSEAAGNRAGGRGAGFTRTRVTLDTGVLLSITASPVGRRAISSGCTISRDTARRYRGCPAREPNGDVIAWVSSHTCSEPAISANVRAEPGTSWRWAIFSAVRPST